MAAINDVITWGADALTSAFNWGTEILNPGTQTGTASGTDLGQSQYDFNYRVFPNDIGMDYVGHYMVININVPTEGFKLGGLAVRSVAGSYGNLVTELNQVSKVDTLRYGGSIGVDRPLLAIPRQTRRIAESIALFMPAGLYWYDKNWYEDISMTEYAGKIGIGIASHVPVVGDTLAGGLASAVNQGGTINQTARIMGNPINPSVEVLFSTKALRTFTFDFLMAPRNEQESNTLKEIMTQLRFHGSPEINPTTLGATWIPPAEFDITIFNKGVENRNIFRINTCVMEDIEVDYHPSGMFSTFRNGHPVQVRMRVTFKEVEPVHKARVLQGF